MARNVFVDTWGWYVLIDRNDPSHSAAAALVRKVLESGGRLVSTDYIIDESCTLARARAGHAAAARLLDLLERTAGLDLEWIGPERFERAKAIFRKHRDQSYSFTDCTSFAVMRERRLNEVITSDQHFRTAGFHVLPSPSR